MENMGATEQRTENNIGIDAIEICSRIVSGRSTLEDRFAFWRCVVSELDMKGCDGERVVGALLYAGVRTLSNPRLLEQVTNEALSRERAMKS